MDINKKRFTISIAKKLLYILEGRTLPSSSLPRWIVDEFRIEGLITGITMAAEFPIALRILWHSADIFQIIIHPALLSKDGLKSFLAITKTCSAVRLCRKPATPKL